MVPVQKTSRKGSPVKLRQVGIILVAMILLLLVLMGMRWSNRKNAYAVTLDGEPIGIVTEESVAKEAFETAKLQMQKELDSNVEVTKELKFEYIHASKKDLVEPNYLVTQIRKALLEDAQAYKVQAYVLTVEDGKEAILPDLETVGAVLNEIKDTYVPEGKAFKIQPIEAKENEAVTPVFGKDDAVAAGSEGTDEESKNPLVGIEFVEKVTVTPVYVRQEDIMTKKQVMEMLTATIENKITYTIESGDSLWSIAASRDMTIEDLLKVNPDLTEDSLLQIGQEVNLVVPKPALSVQTREEIVYTESIPKPVERQEDDEQYKDYKKVIEEGKDGVKEVTANIIRINGYEEGTEVVGEKVIEEPIKSVVVVGTNPVPPKRATGSFQRPTNGVLTSGYGPRWGTNHKGLDLASPTGTAIHAADGGRVVWADWNGTYGKLVKIDHGNGFVTYYGHTSKIYVTVGQMVAKGETIAAVGSTGDSTGPHVHFEIRKNGVPQNPMNYLR